MAALLVDGSKKISGDLRWSARNETGPFLSFQAPVQSDSGWPIFAKGGFNHESLKLSYALIHQGLGKRIYGLCLGQVHRSRPPVGSPHKHKWIGDAEALLVYSPDDITAPSSDPVTAWFEFCREAHITHDGVLEKPTVQRMLF